LAIHFQSNWDNRRVPAINTGPEQTRTSTQRMADILVNHDKAQRETLKMAPEYYE
jgi:N-acyl homoserine lactone hydrolase